MSPPFKSSYSPKQNKIQISHANLQSTPWLSSSGDLCPHFLPLCPWSSLLHPHWSLVGWSPMLLRPQGIFTCCSSLLEGSSSDGYLPSSLSFCHHHYHHLPLYHLFIYTFVIQLCCKLQEGSCSFVTVVVYCCVSPVLFQKRCWYCEGGAEKMSIEWGILERLGGSAG